ncbi:MAG: phosphoribosylamine--glycine ligase, partial [Spirochaetaceae bacterium]|nr:phosphoribosylamine--glycine ligase [Spirochaetaceae bacterium]
MVNVLLIGSGGREHALAWKFSESPQVARVYAAPGNGGICRECRCENVLLEQGDLLSPQGADALVGFARQKNIGLVMVGPEAPLVAGIVDRFRASGFAVAGPDKHSARLEGSKSFAKCFMEKYGVRTARSAHYADYAAACRYAAEYFARQREERPLVIKACGLAAGKGVVIARGYAEAEAVLSAFMRDRVLGPAGETVVLEDFLQGKEVSVLAAVSASPDKGAVIRPFIPSRDYKQRFEDGRGPNTGGMGAVAPVPDFSDAAQSDFMTAILEPTARGMEAEGFDYRGFIFFGLMVDGDLCYLLEYNARLGDPETQAIVPLMDFDFTALCFSLLEHDLESFPLCWKYGAVCAPVAAAHGYPAEVRIGDRITVHRERLARTGARLFIAGAAERADGLYTAGGRVLTVSAWGADREEARTRAYQALEAVQFDGMGYRKDIGLPPQPPAV